MKASTKGCNSYQGMTISLTLLRSKHFCVFRVKLSINHQWYRQALRVRTWCSSRSWWQKHGQVRSWRNKCHGSPNINAWQTTFSLCACQFPHCHLMPFEPIPFKSATQFDVQSPCVHRFFCLQKAACPVSYQAFWHSQSKRAWHQNLGGLSGRDASSFDAKVFAGDFSRFLGTKKQAFAGLS